MMRLSGHESVIPLRESRKKWDEVRRALSSTSPGDSRDL